MGGWGGKILVKLVKLAVEEGVCVPLKYHHGYGHEFGPAGEGGIIDASRAKRERARARGAGVDSTRSLARSLISPSMK